jgi:3,4-dihydroxy-2-butanone 4-phosphate synthase
MDTVEAALSALAAGSMLLCVDDFDRENEGDFIGAAASATPAQLALVVRHSSGIVCAPMSAARARALDLPLMCPANADAFRTAFTVSVDARAGTSTGVSAGDRCATLRALAAPAAAPGDFNRPGHLFPLLAREGGVLARAGHTEASLDLVTLAGAGAVAYLCEVVSSEREAEGDMARLPELQRMAPRLGLPLISIADLQRYRYRRELLVGSSGSGSGSGSGAAAATLHSLHYPGVTYTWQAHALGGGGSSGSGAEAAGGGTTFAVYTSGGEGSAAWLQALLGALGSRAGRLLHVHCTGDTRSNVKWEAQHGPEKGAAEVLADAASAPPSAYAGVFPPPQAAGSASASEAAGVQPCDRTSAELAQVTAAACGGGSAAPRAAFPAAAWSVGGLGVAALPGAREEALAAACQGGWPAVVVVVAASAAAPGGVQCLRPRLWEFGVRVTGVEAL